MATETVFRANVGIVLVNDQGKVLALERSDIKGAWQMPQGGLDEGEEPVTAAVRELWEETAISLKQIQLLQECEDWLVYELPKEMRTAKIGRGQAQKWFLFRFTGTDEHIDLKKAQDQEFSQWKWTELTQLAQDTITFRQPIYQRLAKEFQSHLTT